MVSTTVYARPVWVVFAKRGRVPKWWHLFTTEDFGHCYVLIETMGGVMRIDQSIAGMSFYEYEGTVSEYIQANADSVTDWIRWNVLSNSSVYHLRGLLTCVTVVKAILIKCPWWVFTPKQLYKWMVNNGCSTRRGSPSKS